MITGLAHVNLLVPADTLHHAEEFYGTTLGLTPRPVPQLQKGSLAWFDIGSSGQQVHIALDKNNSNSTKSSRHPCFKIESPDALLQLRQRIWEHHVRGGASAPQEADQPGEMNSGSQGAEYPSRFFARDYAGNRLEFSL
ncbi:hypothetical protein CERZMDRAFT_112452 [Cercospora zeae-maydis SCOH1-5]|uniref:VOC domain-containing protein n=1 Tax=Cercospora zeae-maydis SCOH1-5 TaxID=717836 RepID=A0A6A6FEC9_9PEZI|nr:hypothetical protein CERZMDRAFT_112452 [Cercospora zeae-maydis SCOH1-5]